MPDMETLLDALYASTVTHTDPAKLLAQLAAIDPAIRQHKANNLEMVKARCHVSRIKLNFLRQAEGLPPGTAEQDTATAGARSEDMDPRDAGNDSARS